MDPTIICRWEVYRVSQCQCMRYHGTCMILEVLDESYQNLTKSTEIARKKLVLLWGQKSCFLTIASKSHLIKTNRYTTRQRLSESLSHDPPRPSDLKNERERVQKFIFFWIFVIVRV
jgi:hypothetical protein